MLALLTLLHLAVDGVCGAALYAYAVTEPCFQPIVVTFCLYNLVAFGGQWLAGLWLDRHPEWMRRAFAVSWLLLMTGTCTALGPAVQASALGLGNCLFHVAAGRWVLCRYRTYGELGMMVSSGAIGLALGMNGFCGSLCFVILSGGLTMLAMGKLAATPSPAMEPSRFETDGNGPSLKQPVPLAMTGCAVLLLACVVLRGFGGRGALPEHVLWLPCCFALGKVAGGLVCDRIGLRKTMVFIFILGFLALQLPGIQSLLLFAAAINMTMPLTLRLVHWCRPNRPGMMFGLAAGCLLPGAFFAEAFCAAPHVLLTVQFCALMIAALVMQACGRIAPFTPHS